MVFLRRFRKREKPNFSAIRFDGTPDQAAQIVQLDSSLIRKHRAGGMVIEVYYPNQEPRILRRGDWLVISKMGLLVVPDQLFFDLFEEVA